MSNGASKYEYFLRGAFDLKEGKKEGKETGIGRGGDPAGVASVDCYNSDNLNTVKVGVGYAIQIFNSDIVNNTDPLASEETQEAFASEEKRLNSFTGRVCGASSIDEITQIITDYQTTVLNRYYDEGKEKMTLKWTREKP